MKKSIIQIAVIMAATSIVLFLTQTIYMGGWMYLSLLALIGIGISILIPVFVLRKYRSEQSDRLTFKDGFLIAFLGVALGAFVATVFQVFYTSVIDTDFPTRVANTTVEMTHGLIEGQLGDEQMEEILRKTEQDALERYTVVGALKGYGIGMLVMAVIALIIAAVMKRMPDTPYHKEILDA